jgi:3'(2'), 5'-bisphosphate nucleotidase
MDECETIDMDPITHRKVKELIVRAGQEALRIRESGALTIAKKPDGSDVTNADRASDAILTEGFTQLFPHRAIISEEGKKENPAGSYSSGWVIDPIDGTTSFKNGKPEFSVLAAWVEKGVPTHGFAYFPHPKYGTMYFTGPNGHKAFKQKVTVRKDGEIEFGRPIELKTRVSTGKPMVAEVYTEVKDFFPGEYSVVKDGTAYNTIRMIDGKVNVVAGPHTMADWDLAAEDAIARQADAIFVDVKNKNPLVYGKNRTPDRAYFQERYIGGNAETLQRLGLMNKPDIGSGSIGKA